MGQHHGKAGQSATLLFVWQVVKYALFHGGSTSRAQPSAQAIRALQDLARQDPVHSESECVFLACWAGLVNCCSLHAHRVSTEISGHSRDSSGVNVWGTEDHIISACTCPSYCRGLNNSRYSAALLHTAI